MRAKGRIAGATGTGGFRGGAGLGDSGAGRPVPERPSRPSAEAAAMRGFLFDLNQCTGCHACVLACSTENELGWGRSWRHVVDYNEEGFPSIASHHLSLACNHCLDAPCQRHCPALAIDRDRATGAVLIDEDKCMGCKYCSWACPYDAPQFDSSRGLMAKCTSCHHRLEAGRLPACVEQCPTSALKFGELAGEEIVPGFPVTSARPSIRFVPLRPTRRAPESTWELPAEILRSFQEARKKTRPPPESKITFRGEWPLWILTLIVPALAGWIAAAQAGAAPPPLPLFAAAASLAGAASCLHLGRKLRMWRAILNVRRSWLSREALLFGAFGVTGITHLAWPDVPGAVPIADTLGILAALLGFLTLFSIDRVYDLVRPAGSRLHSADVLLTGLGVAFLLGPSMAVAAGLLFLKLVLYVERFGRERSSPRTWALRILRLVSLALVIFWVVMFRENNGVDIPWVWVVLAAGEATDRAEFYQRLEPITPRRTAQHDLAGAREQAAQALDSI